MFAVSRKGVGTSAGTLLEPGEEETDVVNATVVACCQLAPVLGDPAANRELTAEAVRHADAQGARVVVLPELVSSGYVFESPAEARASAEAADGETVALWARLAASHEIVIVGGFCELSGGEVFNSAALVDLSNSASLCFSCRRSPAAGSSRTSKTGSAASARAISKMR